MTNTAHSGHTAAPVVPHVQLALSEELFSAVLQQCRPSRSRVEAVTQLALRHPANAVDMWTALRKALIGEDDLNSRHNQALWYVLDSLLKHATPIYQPLIAPRLLEYVIQQMPWHLVQWSASVVESNTAGSSASAAVAGASRFMWCERLVRTWQPYLPPALFKPILQHAVHCRSEAELGGALSSSRTQGSSGSASGSPAAKKLVVHPGDPATPDQLRQLTESWQTFYYWCRALEEQQQRRATPNWLQQIMASQAGAESGLAAVAEATASSAAKLPRPSGTRDGSEDDNEDDDEDEDDYDPEFVKGAKPRALPQLDLPRRRREARRRPRDDDDL